MSFSTKKLRFYGTILFYGNILPIELVKSKTSKSDYNLIRTVILTNCLIKW